ncbi:MAG: hypothetical protein UY48_C0004G0022 [Candidatus Gottesmanbacteria bacterium GW2011_GWB1_49_7]|uniref:Uncharacterized protein n=1 Tax=Candidatus Gottesmanbacteria bacterium GW2011_GWB1_49_7 TaxID=1618448 RepID=A0A0G1YDY1_9BACT|nr:MAG: hypothetical protein UY48_C0004G0022 [Candidatus Gottesmanbacteria bacterium GW2011_GWB1_49_7]
MFYVLYCDDGPKGIVPQSVEITGHAEELWIIEDWEGVEEFQRLAVDECQSRRHPRITRIWQDLTSKEERDIYSAVKYWPSIRQ